MATAKSSRSRVSGPLAPPEQMESAKPLGDKLKVFMVESFDPDAFVQSKCESMNEKEIRKLCASLNDLKKASAEEMRRSVYANYTAFIRTSKEISDLEGELLSIRNLLSSQATSIHGLAEGVNIDILDESMNVDSLANGFEGMSIHNLSNIEDREHSDIEKWAADFPDVIDVLLAERRVDEALAALDEAEKVVSEAQAKKMLSPASLASLLGAICEDRMKLADQLAETASQPSTRGAELRSAVSALKKLGDGLRAHSLLLSAHEKRFQYNMKSVRPSSTSYGGAYTAALSQLVFSTIAQAASDSLAVFGEEPAYTSELVIWASKQSEEFALLVKRHALASSAAAGGLRAAAECVQIALGHCSLLESQGLALSPVLLKLFRPSVEQALEANLRRIEESTAAFAAADDWVLTYPPASNRPRSSGTSVGSGTGFQPKLSSSAHRFNMMVQDFFDDVGPLTSLQLGSSTLEGLFKVFDSYVHLLIKALPSMEDEGDEGFSGNKIVRPAENESQQIALLANASLLAEELLPRAFMKLSSMYPTNPKDDIKRRGADRSSRVPEQREWKKRLQRSVDSLRDSFCRHHALDLIFTEDGDTMLSSEMYICMDDSEDEPDWFPSPIFQELYLKLDRIANIAIDMFVGREKFATILLIRLTEAVILWLAKDQNFWDDIEDGPRTLGPFGLKQILLDMEFVVKFSSQGRFITRHLNQVINGITSRVLKAYASTGMDPFSDIPYEGWFGEVAEEAILKLSGKVNMMNGDQEPHSPTASISAHSVSSLRSHGSS